MENNSNFDTFIFISKNELVVTVYSKLNKKIYENNIIIENDIDKIDFEKFNLFLSQNILSIEKEINHFINNVFIILDFNVFFSFDISIKNNFENQVSFDDINRLLSEVKDYCKKTLNEKKISHVIIKNYLIDNVSFTDLPENVYCNSLSLDINFLCVDEKLSKSFENVLKKYQIGLNKIISANYIKDFLSEEENNMCLMAKKITLGYNPNEVMLVNKTTRYRGFFEKFFNFFN